MVRTSVILGRLKTSEVARATGLHPATIRILERKGIIKSIKDVNGWRLFDQSVVEFLRRLYARDQEPTLPVEKPPKAQATTWLRKLENAEARHKANILMLAVKLPTEAYEDFERSMGDKQAVVLDDDSKPLAWASESVCECGHLFSKHAAHASGHACVRCKCEAWREITTCVECGVTLNAVNSYCSLFPLITFNHTQQRAQYVLGCDCYVRVLNDDDGLRFFALPEQS